MCIVSSVDMVKMLLTATLSLTSLLVAVIAFLLNQYLTTKDLPSYVSKPYREFAVVMVIVLLVGGSTCFLSLVYLLDLFPLIRPMLFSFILILFIFILATIMVGIVWVTYKVLHKEG